VTTKVWHDQLAPGALQRAFETSLDKLRLDYVDLYMVQLAGHGHGHGAMLEVLIELREKA